MYRIVKKEALKPTVTLYEIEAPMVAKKAEPGQFIILRVDENGERIPITIHDYDREKGTVTIIVQTIGATTEKLRHKAEGEFLQDFVGPLGRPTETEGKKKVCVVGGGVGCAIAYPVLKKFHDCGAEVHAVVGFKNKDVVILEDKFKSASDVMKLVTDDGSYGEKGLVTDALKQLIEEGNQYDEIFAIGPAIMMKFVSKTTEPYGIPLRSLYSKNVENLMFAGRNISATHIAFSTVRVMGTCGVMGQAVGTAAAMATACGMMPREFCREKIGELQDALMEDDCFLPGMKRKISPLCNEKTLSAVWGDASNLLNGIDRKIWGHDNGYWGIVDRAVTYTFDEVTHLSDFRLIVDSDLDREYTEGNPDVLNISIPLFRRADHDHTTFGFPKCMLRSFKIEIDDGSGEWRTVYETHENYQRMIRERLDVDAKAVRLIPLGTYFSESLWTTYGSAQAHIFSFEVR